MAQSLTDAAILQVALVGLEHQKAEIESKMADIQVRLGGNRRSRPAASFKSLAPERKPLSAAARKRIGAATRKRWAAYRKAKGK